MQNSSSCWCNWWHTTSRKTKIEAPREDPLTLDIKAVSSTEYAKEEPIAKDPKEDPVQDPIKYWHHRVGYSGSDKGRVEIKNNIRSMVGKSLIFKLLRFKGRFANFSFPEGK